MSNHLTYLPDLPDTDWEEGTIYYIMSAETGRMKIGYTKGDVLKRLKQLQTGSPTKLGIVAIHPGTPESERRLHEQFAQFRVHGEWFEVEPELMLHCVETYGMIIALAKHAGREPPEWAVSGRETVLGYLKEMVAEWKAQEEEATIQ